MLMSKVGITVSVLVTLSGLLLVAVYISEAVVSRWGEADQSLLFWYLPFLFAGLILTGGGVAVMVAIGQRRSVRKGDHDG